MNLKVNFKLVLVLFCALVLMSCEKENQKPNIIYMLADDLGYGELGVYGQQKIKTPNIDALAKAGMRFTQHYSGSPVCAPSRCVLLTGKHSGHAYIRGNDEWASRGEVWNYKKMTEDPNLEGQRPIPANTQTLGKLLQSVGYKTACVGKWGLGAPLSEGAPNKQGFDFFYGYNCQRQAHNLYPKHLWKNDQKVPLNNELVAPGTKLEAGVDSMELSVYSKFSQPDYAPESMLTEALDFMDQNQNEPFFLLFASPLPHVPLQVSKEYTDRYLEEFGDEQPYLGNKGYFPNRYPNATYAGMISYLDNQVGAIVEYLKKLGLYENTLIIFSSDNGPTYAGGVDPNYFDSAHPFNNDYGWTKGFVHEGGIRVPMVAVWEGKIKAGASTDHISAFWDVLPTIAEITDFESPKDIDGISFLPTLLGNSNQKSHNFLYWEFPSYKGQQAIRMGKWKGIRRNIFEGNLAIELYDLDTDLKEENNVAEQHPEIVKMIEEIMLQEHTPSAIKKFKIAQIGD